MSNKCVRSYVRYVLLTLHTNAMGSIGMITDEEGERIWLIGESSISTIIMILRRRSERKKNRIESNRSTSSNVELFRCSVKFCDPLS